MKRLETWINEKEHDEWEKLKSKVKAKNDYRLLKALVKQALNEPEKAKGLILACWFFACMYCVQVGFLFLVGLG